MHTADLVGQLAIGDNLHILRQFIDDESIDLVYLDPPFNSNRAYSLIFKDSARGHSEAQAIAFKDQWTWNAGTEARFRDLLIPTVGSRTTTRLSLLLAHQVSAFERTQMAAYLVEMAVRLVELHRVLRSTGSLYLHCDPTASHYLKVVLDAIFGPKNFVAEIIWKRTSAHNDPKRPGRIHDVLLFYSKSTNRTWNPQNQALDQSYIDNVYRYVDDRGRYRLGDLTAPHFSPSRTVEWRGAVPAANRQWRFGLERREALLAAGKIKLKSNGAPSINGYKLYLEDSPGTPIQSIWDDIPNVTGISAEKLGYPTQKPIALLKRVIETSSNPGDVVLDPFCGCGTAIEAARSLGRQWIGIDISVRAVDVIQERFRDGEHVPSLLLAPADEESARRLAETKPDGRRLFEAWALTLIGARKNRDRDRGVDGLIPFIGPRGRIQHALVSVKSGARVTPSEVRDLVGAVHRERAAAGVFLTLGEPTKEMRLEASRATPLIPGIPRIQIITIRDALREDQPARPVLPAYRQDELFETVPPAASDLDDLEDNIRDAIAKGRAAVAEGRREWRAALIEQIQKSFDQETDSSGSASRVIGRSSSRANTGARPAAIIES